MIDLSTSFAGIKLKNPIIIGSSGLTDSLENIIELENKGAAAVVIKSLFEEEILREMKANINSMNSEISIYPEALDFYEDTIYKKESTTDFLNLIEKSRNSANIPIIANINCISAKQWTYFPKLIESAGAHALELNIFILPSDIKRSAQDNEKIYFEIIEEVRSQIKLPLIIKLSPYFSNLASFLNKLSQSGIAGLVLFNRFYNPDFDLDSLEITSGGVLSSPSDFYLSLRWIAIMAERVECSLAASTGVHDGSALTKQLLAGANAVEIASTIYKKGPGQITRMLDELEEWMGKKGFKTIEDFRGKLSQKKSKDPAAYERVQFMKYFRGFPV
ncbi:MAG: dihydroorotate dehydrogenase-like protein [Bacteroidales bacterium]|nr:dihydroorotate dehydrogenase-like protein [Bacteroidales bacterium]